MSEKVSERKGITIGEQVLYGFGGMFKYSLGSYFLSYYWLFFMTDIAKVPTALAATAYSIVTLIKTVTMMYAGALADGTNLKWGKYRSWVLIGDIILLISTGLLFLRFEYNNVYVYIGILLVIWVINQTGYNVSWSASRALVGVMAYTTKDSVALSAAATIASSLGGLAYGFIAPLLMNATNGMYQQYMLVPASLALIFIPGCLACMYVSKKYDLPSADKVAANVPAKKTEKISLKDMMASFKGPGLPYLVSSTVMNAASGFFSTLLIYYTTYVLQNAAYTAYAVSAQSIAGFVAALISPWLCEKFSKKTVYFWSLFLGGIVCAIFYWIGQNGILFLVLRIATTFLTTPVGTAMVAMANDIADWDEMNGYKSAKAFVQSMMGVTIRLGILLSTALSSFGLVAIGYQAGTVPTPEVLDAIMKLMAFGPCIAYCVGALLILFYKVDEKEIERYRLSKLQPSAD